MKNWHWYILSIILIIVLIRACEGEPRTIIKEKTKYVKVTDTFLRTVISEPKTVYVERYKTVKGKDSIIYVSKPNDSTTQANQYDTKLESNNATVNLQITTTGELLDVQGTINYTKEIKTIETTKIRDASGLFIYGSTSLNKIEPEVGVLYQFKNKVFIKAGVELDNITNKPNYKVGFGVKVF